MIWRILGWLFAVGMAGVVLVFAWPAALGCALAVYWAINEDDNMEALGKIAVGLAIAVGGEMLWISWVWA